MSKTSPKPLRIGIYAGTFDPVHAGHISFALQAVQAAKLDELYFLPERRPRAKTQVEHFGHRVAMLKQALKPYQNIGVLELVDVSFSVKRTLPFLEQKFEGAELVYLFGSDIVAGLADWQNVDKLLKDGELVIGLRSQDDKKEIHRIIEQWTTQPRLVTVFDSFAPSVSSGQVRQGLKQRQQVQGLLTSVERYSNRHWLYVSLEQT